MFSDGSIPCEHEYHLLPDVAIESLVNKVIDLLKNEQDVEMEVGYATARLVSLITS